MHSVDRYCHGNGPNLLYLKRPERYKQLPLDRHHQHSKLVGQRHFGLANWCNLAGVQPLGAVNFELSKSG